MSALLHSNLSAVPDHPISHPIPKQRILIVTDAWIPQVNGVVRSYEYMIREFEHMGHAVQVISPQDFRTLPMPGYAEIELALFPYRRLSQRIAAFRPTIIHIAVEGTLGWAARRYCLRNSLPFSTAFHTNFPAYIALRSPKLLRGLLERLTLSVIRRFHAQARHVYVATPSVEALLREWGFEVPFVRLTRGVDCDLFALGSSRPKNDPPVLLYVGRVAPEKSLENFLSLGSEQIGPARKVIVGDGPSLPDLKRAYPDATFLGTLTGSALAEAYRAADVFVFPSRTDTFGMVLVEALASGLPIAAHDVPGPRDIVTDPLLGALDNDLARAIMLALAAPGTREQRSAYAQATYDWNAVAMTFLLNDVDIHMSDKSDSLARER